MNAIVIPVKSLAESKQRLGRRFTSVERTTLALAMFRDVLTAAALCRSAGRIYIVSNDERIRSEVPRTDKRTEGPSFEFISEGSDRGENGAVALSTKIAISKRTSGLLIVPADVPLILADDIDAVFEASSETREAVIVPSRDRDGTNALLLRPPGVLPTHFGPGSFARHRAEADRLNIPLTVLENSRIELDIDTPLDVSRFAAIRSSSHTYRALFDMRYF